MCKPLSRASRDLAKHCFQFNGKLRLARRNFSATPTRRDIMEMTGFNQSQLTVREAISQICSKFPNSYWQEHDQETKDPQKFHTALAQNGWLGIAIPEELGGAGLGMSAISLLIALIDFI